MTLANTAGLIAGRRGFPSIPGLYMHFEATASENTLIDTDTKITVLADLSGNGRDATSAGETYEATGLSTGTPAIRTNGTRLLHSSALVSDKVSAFWVAQGAQLQVINEGTGNDSEINSIWTVNANTQLMRNNVSATIAQGNYGAFDAYSDEVSRSFAWVYDDTTNIRQFYANGVLVQDSGDWSGGTAAGSIDFVKIGRGISESTNRIGAILIYEAQLLTQAQVAALHFYYKNVKGII